MNDPRLTPFSGRVAHVTLKGTLTAPAYTEGRRQRLTAPLADLLRTPAGSRDRQLLSGAALCVIDQQGEMAYVRAEYDGYCGWIDRSTLGPYLDMTHRVAAPATHLYAAPDIKSEATATLSLNATVRITEASGNFLRRHDGAWLPKQHLQPVDQPETDPVAVAEKLIGTPYLWGGNSRAGLDCSALVQLALQACNHPCPADSDLQERALSARLPEGAQARRGDLLFWPGHVAWVSAPDMILHANAHTMSVAYEPLSAALARIGATTPLSAHVRLSL